jgi:hypothetical protein
VNISKIGNIEFSAVTGEEVSFENDVTNRAVEDIGYISDHVKPKPVSFTISGVVVGEDAFNKLKTLRKYCQGKKVYRYIGRNIMYNVVIESLTTTHNKETQNGFTFNMTCKIIKQAKSKKVKLQAPDTVKKTKPKQTVKKKTLRTAKKRVKSYAPTRVQTAKPSSVGKKVPVKKQVDKQKVQKYNETEIKRLSQKRLRDVTMGESLTIIKYNLEKKGIR